MHIMYGGNEKIIYENCFYEYEDSFREVAASQWELVIVIGVDGIGRHFTEINEEGDPIFKIDAPNIQI